MKNWQQTKDLIKNLSKKLNVKVHVLQRIYMQERLLERIARSDLRDDFVLKGGMLITALIGTDLRSTIDMDATIKTGPLSEEMVRKAFEHILSVPVDDGISFELLKIERIRDHDEHMSFRLSLTAIMETARIPVKIDITTGDVITPSEVNFSYELLLEGRSINILAYNMETVIAEKIETLLSLGAANTRMKDFYDIYILVKIHGHKIDINLLREALSATVVKRGSEKRLIEAELIFHEVFSSDAMRIQWTQYRTNYPYAKEIMWDEIREVVVDLWENMNI